MADDRVGRTVARAGQLFLSGYHCSEAVVIAAGEHYLGQVPDILIRASCPFGGGVGGCREEVCGAMSGGIMIMGVLRGRVLPTENDEALRLLARQYRDWFMRRYGDCRCNPIRNQMPEVEKRCRPVVEEGVRALIELLDAGK